MAARRSCQRRVRGRALRGVWLRNRDWAATYQAIPRLIDDELAKHGATRVLERAEGDAREDLGGQFDAWFAKVRALAAQQLGADASFSAEAGAEPLYRVDPVGPSAAPAPPPQRERRR